MEQLTKLRRGLAGIPAAVEQYGMQAGLHRWFGLMYQTVTGEISGRSMFAEDWEVCIVLDACRADELERFGETFDWLDTVGRFPSLASCTWNWVPRTVAQTDRETLQDTTYVAGNPFVDELTDSGTFGEVDDVFRYAWDDDRGTVYPRPVTDRAIRQWRSNDPDRLVVHYLQPHVPFLSRDAEPLDARNFTHDEDSVRDAWDRVTAGDLSRSVAVDRYRQTLETVLQDVDLLLSSIDADDVVVTADHGEAFGEWGIYGHPQNIDLPCLTQVPWVLTTATDDGEYEPADYERDRAAPERGEQLRALGYVESRADS